jgi:hypothetical protein
MLQSTLFALWNGTFNDTEQRFATMCEQSTERAIYIINTVILDRTTHESPRIVRMPICGAMCPGFDGRKVKGYAMANGIWCQITKPRTRITLANVGQVHCGGACTKSEYCSIMLLEIPAPRGYFDEPIKCTE